RKKKEGKGILIEYQTSNVIHLFTPSKITGLGVSACSARTRPTAKEISHAKILIECWACIIICCIKRVLSGVPLLCLSLFFFLFVFLCLSFSFSFSFSLFLFLLTS